MTPEYSVMFYVNNTLQKTIEHLSAQDAYLHAVPNDANKNVVNNPWHLMLRSPAIQRMGVLFVGETIRIAWQDPQPVNTHYILILRTY